MSIRAYKLIEIKTEDNPTFSVSGDYDIYMLGNDENGVLAFDKDTIVKALKTEKNKDKRKILKNILKDMGDEDYVEYYCC